MRFVCISDTHRRHWEVDVPDGDVLLHAGDFSMQGHAWWVKDFNRWMGELPHEHKIVIAGNHEVTFDAGMYGEESHRDYVKALLTNLTYLNQEMVEIEGIKIWGEPRQPEFLTWAFNVPRDLMKTEVWNHVPDDIDILLTHGPPAGYGDLAKDLHSEKMIHVGCEAQREMLHFHPNIKAVVCGHIHSGYGKYTMDNGIEVYNASVCTESYRPVNPPLVFDM